MPSPLGDPVKLPCGLVLPNRLSKAAMAEMLGGWGNKPTSDLLEAYNQWAQGGWGSILTGNVQVDINHLGSPFDTAIHGTYSDKTTDSAVVAEWTRYAEACQAHGTPGIVQLCHPGRQSFRPAGRRGIFGATIAPSEIPLTLGEGYLERAVSRLVFPAPREMTSADIERVTRCFVDAARVMADAGFSGVELHGAHGYLVDQFLNAKTNLRTDAYGGTAEKRAKFILDIIAETRKVVPSTFCVGIKLNSADHTSSTFEDTMTQIGLLVEAGIDFLEISGGSYEDPKMMGLTEPPKSTRTAAREAFFFEFATETRKRFPGLILMLTGGFRSRAGAEAAIQANACDLIGMGRPSAVNAKLPHLLLDESVSDEEAGLPLGKVQLPWLLRVLPLKAVGAGAETTYYAEQIKRLAKGLSTFVPALTK